MCVILCVGALPLGVEINIHTTYTVLIQLNCELFYCQDRIEVRVMIVDSNVAPVITCPTSISIVDVSHKCTSSVTCVYTQSRLLHHL